MGWGRIALSRQGESPALPCEEREEKEGLGSLSRLFLYHLELGGGETLCHPLAPFTCVLGGGALESQTIPNLACLKLPLRENIPKMLFGIVEGGGPSSVAASSSQGTVDPTYQKYCPFPIAVPGDLNSECCCLNLCPAQARLFMGILSSKVDSPVMPYFGPYRPWF
jgi:hypothetical protein